MSAVLQRVAMMERNSVSMLGSSLSPPSMEGSLLRGCYFVEEKIEAQAIFCSYRVMHVRREETMLCRILHPDLIGNEAVRHRFVTEARIQARLKHPHLVRVFEIVDEAECVAVIQEWVDGPSLQEYLVSRRSLLRAGQVWACLHPLLEALAYAHDRGVIHRALRPDQILFQPRGATQALSLKLTNFSVVKASEEIDTNIFQFRGGERWYYLAPEQFFEDREIDQRADIYALGVLLYQLATGRLPFVGSVERLMQLHRASWPQPPSALYPSLPRGFDSVVLRCLAKQPEERWSNCRELSEALARVCPPIEPLLPVFAVPHSSLSFDAFDASSSGELSLPSMRDVTEADMRTRPLYHLHSQTQLLPPSQDNTRDSYPSFDAYTPVSEASEDGYVSLHNTTTQWNKPSSRQDNPLLHRASQTFPKPAFLEGTSLELEFVTHEDGSVSFDVIDKAKELPIDERAHEAWEGLDEAELSQPSLERAQSHDKPEELRFAEPSWASHRISGGDSSASLDALCSGAHAQEEDALVEFALREGREGAAVEDEAVLSVSAHVRQTFASLETTPSPPQSSMWKMLLLVALCVIGGLAIAWFQKHRTALSPKASVGTRAPSSRAVKKASSVPISHSACRRGLLVQISPADALVRVRWSRHLMLAKSSVCLQAKPGQRFHFSAPGYQACRLEISKDTKQPQRIRLVSGKAETQSVRSCSP